MTFSSKGEGELRYLLKSALEMKKTHSYVNEKCSSKRDWTGVYLFVCSVIYFTEAEDVLGREGGEGSDTHKFSFMSAWILSPPKVHIRLLLQIAKLEYLVKKIM